MASYKWYTYIIIYCKKFRIISDHSLECYNYEKTGPANNNMINEWEDFTNKCFNYLNNFKGVFDNTVFSRLLTKG